MTKRDGITGRTPKSLASIEDVKQIVEMYLAAFHENEVAPLKRPWWIRLRDKLKRRGGA